MNYTEYNNQLKLPDDLYKKTLAGVKSEVSKHNRIQRKKKVKSRRRMPWKILWAGKV